MSEQSGRALEPEFNPVASMGEGMAERSTGRHRSHRFPGRSKAVKVLYDEEEFAAVQHAARQAGLRPSSYVASAALATAQGEAGPGGGVEREHLQELLQARLAVRRFGFNLNQVAAVLNAGGEGPAWLARAVGDGERAIARIDEATAKLSRRLP